ncbi:hypothetical protein WPS_12090 [Vulcanimicrobium alpinum]|uniref:Glycosyltransferase n=1 Tax=Vulcanimicrobium alpinum TaxID=3016050 RepID=A0AAN1XX28_UNVUL|nr:hypothetical protein [Vulcanimicrobium alpinum]BDE05933.1 hypothetical protein WPS_12090 [Vulcanimicrobium alpinum]
MRAHRWPSLDHLRALTDDVGILQHATLDVPNRSCGYCTDDVGRALIVACESAASDPHDRDAARLVSTYLAYLHDAQLPDGWFHNFMGYDRRWQDDRGTPDAVGRAIWGLGHAERYATRATWRALAGSLRRRALDGVAQMEYVRSRAYAILGLVQSLATHPDDELALRAAIDAAAAAIADEYDLHRAADWEWCEPTMTYDNARIPEALLRAGEALRSERYRAAGLAMLAFYARVTMVPSPHALGATIFEPVGNAGWYPRGGTKARFGQQPLEAAAMVDAAIAAHALQDGAGWLDVAETAHAWYLGANAHGATLAHDGGCCDGLDAEAINPNRGAESTVSYLMSAIALAKRSPATLRIVTG